MIKKSIGTIIRQKYLSIITKLKIKPWDDIKYLKLVDITPILIDGLHKRICAIKIQRKFRNYIKIRNLNKEQFIKEQHKEIKELKK